MDDIKSKRCTKNSTPNMQAVLQIVDVDPSEEFTAQDLKHKISSTSTTLDDRKSNNMNSNSSTTQDHKISSSSIAAVSLILDDSKINTKNCNSNSSTAEDHQTGSSSSTTNTNTKNTNQMEPKDEGGPAAHTSPTLLRRQTALRSSTERATVPGAVAHFSTNAVGLELTFTPYEPAPVDVGSSPEPPPPREEEERHSHHQDPSDRSPAESFTTTAIPTSIPEIPTAQLVDEEEAEAKKREFDRLKAELEQLREINKAHQAQQSSEVVVVAEPITQQRLRSSRRFAHSVPLSRTKSSELIGMIGSSASGVFTSPSQELSIFTSSRKMDEQEKMTELKANRLRYSSLGLYGRDEETKIVLDCLQQSTGTLRMRTHLLLIRGYSGVGKSSLVDHAYGGNSSSTSSIIAQRGGLLVKGKFDLYRDEPYYGIAAACREMCDAMMNLQTSRSRSRSFHDVYDKLVTELSPQDIQLLTKVVPELSKITTYFDSPNDEDDQQESKLQQVHTSPRGTATATAIESDGVTSDEEEDSSNKARLHFVFRTFLRFVSSYFAPFVMVLDDLQAADPASLDLMLAIMTDQDNPGFLLIGLYRSNEVEDANGKGLDSHILTSVLNDLKERRQQSNFDITEIELGNLPLEAVQSVIMDLLSVDLTDNVKELASVCHKRTHGNGFFLISFLAMLEEDGFLDYDLHASKYTWDIETIKSETGAASNIVDLMKQKMTKLPLQTGQLLSMAACLGSSFERSKLEVVWGQFNSSSIDDQDSISVEERLSCAVAEGYLESFGGESLKYRWIHDKIQESAFTLIPANELSHFKFQVGNVLRKQMSEEETAENVFLVINLLNETPKDPLTEEQQSELAQLNLRATQKAVSCSAFSSAASYASKGIELLSATCWTSHYQTTLDLYSYAAEIQELIGNYDTMKIYCDEVLTKELPILDQVRVYNVLSSKMASSGQHVDAVALLLKVLRRCGCKFPKSTAGILCATISGLMKAKSTLKFRTAKEAARLPIMKDKLQLETMKLIDKLITYTHLCGSDLCGLAILKSTQLTLKHGVCEVSPTAFAATATILTGVLGDLQGGSMMGEYALRLARKLDSPTAVARTKFVAVAFAFPWTKPMQSISRTALGAYSEGMRCGDTETATFVIYSYMALSFSAGRSLRQIESDCAIYTKQMKELKREQAYDYTVTLWQLVLNLMGFSQDATRLQGEALLNLEEFVEVHRDNGPMMSMIYSQQMRLFAVLGEYERGANMFCDHGYDWPKSSPGHPSFMDAVCWGGIAAFAMTRRKKRGYQKHAKKAHATIKGWVRKGNPNVKHWGVLFDAELAALQGKGKHKAAEMYYQSAIATASRSGFTPEAALANERYSDFMLTVLGDKEGAVFHLTKAIELYADWGATKKVELMREQHAGGLLPIPNEMKDHVAPF